MNSLTPPKILWYIKVAHMSGEWIHAHPFVWDSIRHGPKVIRAKHKLRTWYLNVIVTVFYYCFVLLRCLQVNFWDSRSHIDDHHRKVMRIYTIFTTIFYIFPVVFQFALVLKKDELPNFVYSYVRMMQNMEGQLELKSTEKMMKICELFMGFVYYAFMILGLLIWILAWLKPESPEFVSSLFVSHDQGGHNVMCPLERTIFSLLHLYIVIMYVANAYLLVFPALGFIFASLAVIEDLWCSWTGSHQKNNVVRTEKFVRLYKLLQISLGQFYQVYLTFLYPVTKMVLILFAIFCTFAAVKMHRFLALTMALIGSVTSIFLVVLTSFFGQFHSQSTSILQRLRSRGLFSRNCELSKEMLALRPLTIRVNFLYFVDKKLVLTIMKIIFDSSINFLLANRE